MIAELNSGIDEPPKREPNLIIHATGAPGLRILGLGPLLLPTQGLKKLKTLFDLNTSWAMGRDENQLKVMLANSDVVITLWSFKNLIGFGRATSDYAFRAILWDIVVADDLQGYGYGKVIVNALLNSKAIKKAEKTYLMTSNCSDFYQQVGFEIVNNQRLMLAKKKESN
tara:strand:- start:65 stop:571 length:507 start_codon:yes stop_codon:yes gene_type:complete